MSAELDQHLWHSVSEKPDKDGLFQSSYTELHQTVHTCVFNKVVTTAPNLTRNILSLD